MAHKSKILKAKKRDTRRARYHGGRADYRKGGRVGYEIGGRAEEERPLATRALIPQGEPRGKINPNLKPPPVMDAAQKERMRKAQEAAVAQDAERKQDLLGEPNPDKRGRGSREGQPLTVAQEREAVMRQPPTSSGGKRQATPAPTPAKAEAEAEEEEDTLEGETVEEETVEEETVEEETEEEETEEDTTTDGLEIGDLDPNGTGLVWDGTTYVRPEGISDTATWDGTSWVEPTATEEETEEEWDGTYGEQTADSELSDEMVLNSNGSQILDADGNPQPQWYMDTVSGKWQPTQAMLDQEATYGRSWDVDTQDWITADDGDGQDGQDNIDSETGYIWNGTEYVRPTEGIGSFDSAAWNGTEWEFVNPMLAGSELGNWVADQGEDGNRKLYKIDGDVSSGYLMTIFWVDAEGNIDYTDDGWSRVPDENRKRVFRTQSDAVAFMGSYENYQADLANFRAGKTADSLATGFGGAATATEERRERIDRTATGIEAAREGVTVDQEGNVVDLSIPDAVKAGGYQLDAAGNPILDEDNNPILAVADQDASESDIALTDMPDDVVATTAGGFEKNEDGTLALDGKGNPIPVIKKETVADAISTRAGGFEEDSNGNVIKDADGNPIPVIKDVTASEFTATQVDQFVKNTDGSYVTDAQGNPIKVADVIPAVGAIAEDSKAIVKMQTQALTKAATGVTIEDEDAIEALQDRVVGTIDEETTAATVVVAGTTLPKILRAKKQLRKAGFSESTIAALGNDIEKLEEELSNLTEAEKGMIEGLPEEAMVDVQLDALLKGMESGEIPAFARPAVAAVNQMLAARGLDASTVGRDALYNAIITSAIPIAQSNAQSIKESVLSQ